VQAAIKALAPALKRLSGPLSKLDPAKLPMGQVADLLYDLRQSAKLLTTTVAGFDDVIPPAIKALEEHFIQSLKVGEASGVQGMRSRVQVTDDPVPVVKPEAWSKLYAYIARTKQWELLNKAINRAAVKERWAAKKQVPGVDVFHVKKVSCTKLGGK